MLKRGQNHTERKRDRQDEKLPAPVFTAHYTVARSEELLPFLLRKMSTSRNNVKMLLSDKHILVNGKLTTKFDYLLAKDDEVKIAKHPVQDGKMQDFTQKREKKDKQKPIKILLETEEFLAIDKPEGLLSVESDKERESAYLFVADYLQAKGKNLRPFVLHRIDKETSGVLLFAKDVKIHSMLKLRWNELVFLREYYAVVEGKLPEKSKEIVSYLKQNANNIVYETADRTGQKALTKYEVVKESDKYSLLRVEIETGRKNQIRVAMQSLGNPVVGDEKYGSGTKSPIARLGLHASALGFRHPRTGEEIVLRAPLPESFSSLFAKK